MRVLLIIGLLSLVACKPSRYDDVYKQGQSPETERDIFLECLTRTKSSVTTTNDDEDTDDTISACKGAAYGITQDYECVKNCR